MIGFAILLFFNFLGLLLQKECGVPIPANVLGMVLLSLGLFTGWIKLSWVESASNFLLHHMLLFFVPFLVMSLGLLALLQANAITITVGLVLSSLLTLAVTGFVAQWLMPKVEDKP